MSDAYATLRSHPCFQGSIDGNVTTDRPFDYSVDPIEARASVPASRMPEPAVRTGLAPSGKTLAQATFRFLKRLVTAGSPR
uniref:hypothetical protein n=1 Tax=uncultured Sphingomonas sp. TaxID=158754 RepID=UPI0035CB6ED4